MTNAESWDRIAARHHEVSGRSTTVVEYGRDIPDERELRLLGDVKGKRVLDLGCGAGYAAMALARQGAHVVAIDGSEVQLQLGRRLAEAEELKVEFRHGDLADLAFLRADSIDLALSVSALPEVADVDRVFRQVHRVLRPGAAFVFAYLHPMALCVQREAAPDDEPALPLAPLAVERAYFDARPTTVVRLGERFTVYRRTIGDVFAALGRAGFRVEHLLEPEPRTSEPVATIPSTIVWRARKEGV